MNADGGTTGIGAPVRRREDQRLLTGQGRYSDDLTLPGSGLRGHAALAARPRRNRVDRYDTGRGAPGVLAVLTGKDMQRTGCGASRTRPGRAIRRRSLCRTPMEQSPLAPRISAWPPRSARHVGDIVAVVVATSVTAARDASELIEIDYRPRASVSHALAAAAPKAPSPGSRSVEHVHRLSGRRTPPRSMPLSPPRRMWCGSRPGCSASPACRWSLAPRSVNTIR